jgi:hypothetical protein
LSLYGYHEFRTVGEDSKGVLVAKSSIDVDVDIERLRDTASDSCLGMEIWTHVIGPSHLQK